MCDEQTDHQFDVIMTRTIDGTSLLFKWFLFQNIILFLFPGIWGYNLGMVVLIALYTLFFGIYFLLLIGEKRFNFIFIPYLLYAFAALFCKLTWSALFPSIISCILLPCFGVLCVILFRMARKWIMRTCDTKLKRLFVPVVILALLFLIKGVGTLWQCRGNGSIAGEEKEILQRRDYLVDKLVTSPSKVLRTMPMGIGSQFQGEWALYSCSMLSAALTNISLIYPDTKHVNLQNIDSLIQIVISPELRRYDKERWGEDPLTSLDGDESHVSYLSHLAWMICGYKNAGGDKKYDKLLASLCKTMNRRLLESKCLNLATYPGEPIYIPDMLVAIVALSQYSKISGGMYSSTVKRWVKRANSVWMDKDTGLLVSFLQDNGEQIEGAPVKGSYSALNCSYLSYIDEDFAYDQYIKLKKHFLKKGMLSGFKEYHNRICILGFDMDAGPIIGGMSPSGTAFAVGAVTYFGDNDIRNSILRTAEVAGHTLCWDGKRHYALADVALVGEAIMLAMRTHYKKTKS